MTDPDAPRETVIVEDRPEVVHHTTINNPPAERSGGGAGWLAFLVGGLVVVLAIIAVVVMNNRGEVPNPTKDVNIDVNLPEVPQPKMSDLPSPSAPN